jgi:hypothetical protein
MSQFPASQRQPTPHAPSSQRHPPAGRPVWSSPPWPSPSPSRRRWGVLALPAQGHRRDPLRQELQPGVDLRCGNGKSSLALTAAALLHCECVINVKSFHPCLILELRAYSIKSLLRTHVFCLHFYIVYCYWVVAIFLIIVPDGYSIPTRNLTGMGMKFYPQVWVWI